MCECYHMTGPADQKVDPAYNHNARAYLLGRYVEQLEKLKSQEKGIVRNTQVVEQMYALLAQYEVKAPSEDMVQVDDLRTIQVPPYTSQTSRFFHN